MKKVKLLVDDSSSWMTPFAKKITKNLVDLGINASFIDSHDAIGNGWILFLLSCSKKLQNLELFKHNIVIHASDLPSGKGWSPITWQILEGKNEIPLTVFEAEDGIDSGPIYFKESIELKGNELINEIRVLLVSKIEKLILKFIKQSHKDPVPQSGISTYYKRRLPINSQLDLNKTIMQQFNLLRVLDNERYPGYFFYMGEKYIIKIFKEKNV